MGGAVVQIRNAADWIANYIKEQGFSAKDISFRLKLPEDKLRGGGSAELSAEEFLDICSYLHVAPERIREEINKICD